jgi:hypothetical protein
VLEVLNVAWGVDWPQAKDGVQIALAAITPLLVWFAPKFSWVKHDGH